MNTDYINIVNSNLEKYLKIEYPNIIYESMNYSILGGGKRVRPCLLLGSYNAFGGNKIEEAVPFACAIEMIHTYSLIHDDLPGMDDDDYRRGKLSNHKVFGEGMAILAGDAFLNYAYEIMLNFSIEKFEKKYFLAMQKIAEAAGLKGMIKGQVLDIISENKQIDEKTLLSIDKNKTAKILQASMLAGGILANASKEDLIKIEEAGYYLGISFQIKDDLLDIQSTTEVLGKPINSDIKNNKSTYISIYGEKKAENDLKKYTDKTIEILNELKLMNEFLQDFILKLLERIN